MPMPKRFSDLPTPVQIVILIGGAAILAGATFWYYVLPLSQKRDNLDKDVKKLHAENLKNLAFEQERTEYLNRIAQLEKQLETLRTIVPDEQATDEFMTTIIDAGQATGTFIRTFTAQALVARDFYYEVPFGLRIDGTYYGLLAFFDRLAHQQRIISVINLTLGPAAGGGMGAYTIHPNETVGANCVVVTYFNRQAAPTPPKRK